MRKLAFELTHLGASSFVLELDVPQWAIRQDGEVRADLRANQRGVRVILAAETKKGPLLIPCGTFTEERANIYAIALTLEKLRAVDRYGVTLAGEQYRGFTAIPATTSVTTKVNAAWDLLVRTAAGESGAAVSAEHRTRATLDQYFLEAAKIAHPDVGGSDELMSAVNRARETILADLVG